MKSNAIPYPIIQHNEWTWWKPYSDWMNCTQGPWLPFRVWHLCSRGPRGGEIQKYQKNENAGALTRPSATCPLCQYSCPKFVKGCQDVMLWRHDVVPWRHDVPWPSCSDKLDLHNTIKRLKITFFNMATLNFDLWPWPSNSSETLSRSIMTLNFGSVRQTVRPWECQLTDRHTRTHTHTRDRFYTLDRWRGREWRIPLHGFLKYFCIRT